MFIPSCPSHLCCPRLDRRRRDQIVDFPVIEVNIASQPWNRHELTMIPLALSKRFRYQE
jgi:hypothetical protein